MMRDLHERYPQYGFDRHKGYVTDDHVRALAEHGPSPVHRYSFVNVIRAANGFNGAAPGQQQDPAGALEVLVALGMRPAGASGENERRMSS
jgi:ribonuclease HII